MYVDKSGAWKSSSYIIMEREDVTLKQSGHRQFPSWHTIVRLLEFTSTKPLATIWDNALHDNKKNLSLGHKMSHLSHDSHLLQRISSDSII